MVAITTSYIYRALGSAATWDRKGRRLAILIYHRVLDGPDPCRQDEIDRETFDWQMDAVARHFRVLSLGEAIDRLERGSLPARAACITFDDGYADNFGSALPILQKHGLTATFFVATAFLDGGRMWNDSIIESVRAAEQGVLDLQNCGLGEYHIENDHSRQNTIKILIDKLKYIEVAQRSELVANITDVVGKPLPNDLMMTSDDVRSLSEAGMEIGAHTVNHPILAKVDNSVAQWEISQSRRELEGIIDKSVDLFAYPNGKPDQDYRNRDARLVRDMGFKGAVSTAWGAATPGSDPYQLPRFTPWDRTPNRFLIRLLQNYRRQSVLAKD